MNNDLSKLLLGAGTIDGLERPTLDEEAEILRKNKPISMEMSEHKADPRATEFFEQFKSLEAKERTYKTEEVIENFTCEPIDVANRYAIHSIIFGVLSFLTIGITAIFGFCACGVSFQRKRYSLNKKWRTKAIIGIVLNTLGVVFWIVLFIITFPEQ
jgi:hypothetical protein